MKDYLLSTASVTFKDIFQEHDVEWINEALDFWGGKEITKDEFFDMKSASKANGVPKRETAKSAGYDLASIVDVTIPAHGTKTVLFGNSFLGSFVEDFYTRLYAVCAPRSSLAKKKGLIMTSGIKLFLSGSAFICEFYNFTNSPVEITKGERLVQVVFTSDIEFNRDLGEVIFPKSLLVEDRFELVAGNITAADPINLCKLSDWNRSQFPLQAHCYDPYVLEPGKVTMVKTGLKCRLDDNQVLFIAKHFSAPTVVLANGVGIVDADYYGNDSNDGEIGVLLLNLGTEPIKVNSGDVVAKGIVANYITVSGDKAGGIRNGGFGSTGSM